MSNALKSIPLDYFLYLVLFIASIIHIPIYEDSTSQSTLNVYHFLVITLSFTAIICTKVIYKIDRWLTAFYLYLAVITCYGLITRGVNIRFSLLVFSGTALILSFYFSYRHHANIRHLGKILFVFILVFLALRNAFYANDISSIYSRARNDGGLFFMSSGGRNIEATLLGLSSILLIRSRLYPIAIAIASISSILMMSRAGLLACSISAFSFCYIRGWYYLVLLASSSIPPILFAPSFIDSDLLSRFSLQSEIALEAENQGRLSIWLNSLALAKTNIFGSGVGFGFDMLRDQSGIEYRENNFHNIFIQFFIESGYIGLLLFMASMISVLRKSIRAKELECFWFMLSYLILGLVQFTGYEVFFWLVVGNALGNYHWKDSQRSLVTYDGNAPLYNKVD